MKTSFSVLAIIFIFLCNTLPVMGWSLPPSIDVTEIKFRYGSGSPAIPIKKNNGITLITNPEWQYNPTTDQLIKNDRFAYIKGESPAIIANFYADQYDTPELTIQAYPVMGALNWSLSGAVDFSSNYSGDHFFYTESGRSVPSGIGSQWVVFSWRITAIGGEPLLPTCHLANTSHYFYTVFASPTSFYDGEYGKPWTEMLDRACVWAANQSTEAACLSSLTSSLHSFPSSKMYYDDGRHFSTGAEVDLQALLVSLSANDTTKADCQDYSNFLCLLAYSIGLSYFSSTNKVEYATIGSDFQTNTLFPAGHSSPSSPFWGIHQVVHFQGDMIADASAKVYNGGWILARGDISWTSYKPLLTADSGVSIISTGLSYAKTP